MHGARSTCCMEPLLCMAAWPAPMRRLPGPDGGSDAVRTGPIMLPCCASMLLPACMLVPADICRGQQRRLSGCRSKAVTSKSTHGLLRF